MGHLLVRASGLVGQGIPVNELGANIIARVPITVGVGKQLNYAPFRPTRTSADVLVGKSINNFDIWLTDQSNRELDMANEFWDVLIVIRWMTPA